LIDTKNPRAQLSEFLVDKRLYFCEDVLKQKFAVKKEGNSMIEERKHMTAGDYFESRPDMIRVKALVDMKSFRVRKPADLQRVANYLGIPNEHRPSVRKLEWLIDQIKQALPRLLDVKARNITVGKKLIVLGERLEVTCVQRDGMVRYKGKKGCFNPIKADLVSE
jgi:hypothetical protein